MSEYGDDGYKWRDGKYFDKYSDADGRTTLDAADDAATQNLGEDCRMATKNEFKELLNNCSCSWTTMYGVNGYGGFYKLPP